MSKNVKSWLIRDCLPGPLKASIENLSGLSMDDVRVHYNSQKPAKLQAKAHNSKIKPQFLSSTPSLRLQRKCACGASKQSFGEECEDCNKKKLLGLQAKLAIGENNDVYEQEADRVAAQVMNGGYATDSSVAPLQLQRLGSGGSGLGEAPDVVQQVLSSPGSALDDDTRSFFESRFRHDFSGVRVHTDATAEKSARDVNAHAYTVGNHMVFAPGRFTPGTHDGKGLIAHELAHVVQQSGVDGPSIVKDQIGGGASASSTFSSTNRSLETTTDRHAVRASRTARHNQVSLQRRLDHPEHQATDFTTELDSDFEQIVSVLDHFHYSDKDEELVTGILEKWGERSASKGGATTGGNFLDKIFTRLTQKTKRIGVVTEEVTSYYSLIFNHFDSMDRVRTIRDTYSSNFKQDEGIAEVSTKDQLKEGGLKKTTEEFWSTKFKDMGEELKRIGTPEVVQNLLGGVTGVIQGFAELALELVEGIWSLAEALKNVQDALMHIVMGAAQELGFEFLQKMPLIGRLFNPETYKPGFDATANFFQAAKGALQDPGRVWQSVKAAAVQAWEEVIMEYGKADQFNKSRIIARGVVKVGMAIGGAIKDLPKLARSAGKILTKLSQFAVKAVKVIAEALKGAIKIGKKVFKGAWNVVREMLEDGSSRLRYFFKRAGAAVADEIPAEEAAPFIKCSTCKITPEGHALEEIANNSDAAFPKKGFGASTPTGREGLPAPKSALADEAKGATKRRESFANDPDFHESIKELEDVPGAKGEPGGPLNDPLHTEPLEPRTRKQTGVSLEEDHHIATRYRKKNITIFKKAGISIDHDLNLIKDFPEHGQLRGWYDWKNRSYKFNMKGHHREYNNWVTKTLTNATPRRLTPDQALDRILQVNQRLETIIIQHPEVLSHGPDILPPHIYRS